MYAYLLLFYWQKTFFAYKTSINRESISGFMYIYLRGGLEMNRAINIIFVIYFIAFSNLAFSNDGYQSEIAQVEALLDDCYNPDIPGGYAMAIIKDGKVVFKKCYGYANNEHDIPFTSSTVFDFASVAKQFTGYAIASLIKEGKLSLDDDIRLYLPEVPDFGKKITIRNLLSHTSGIRDWVGLAKLSGRGMEDVISDDFIMNLVKHQKELNFDPGEKFCYSNTGYFLLAKIVAQVTNKSFREWTEDNIFKPLGMTDTHFMEDHREIIKNRASSYRSNENGIYVNSSSNLSSYGSSSLFSTLDDMIKWQLFLEEKIVESDDIVKMMIQKGVLNDGKEVDYGFGISINLFDGILNYGHGGSWSGYACQITCFPEQQFSLILMLSRRPSGCYVEEKAYRIFLGKSITGKEAQEEKPTTRTEVEINPKILDDYIGKYFIRSSSKRHIIITIERKDDNLLMLVPGYPDTILYPESDSTFFSKDAGFQISFQRNEKKYVHQLTYNPDSGRAAVFARLDPALSTIEKVKEYCGEYYCDELQTLYILKIENGQLIAEHLHNEKVLLTSLPEDCCQGDKWWFSELIFERDNNNHIKGFRLNADNNNIQNLLFTKR